MQQREVGSFEAKTHFSQLLTEVAEGNDIIITKHGKRVATLTSYIEPTKANPIKEALEAIDNLHLKLNPPGVKEKLTIKGLINEGRKY